MAKAAQNGPGPDASERAKHRVYLAAPLFTLLERRANRSLARAIQAQWPEVEIFLPQDLKHGGKFNDPRAFGLIFRKCLAELQDCQAVLAWLDGADNDSGTCFEVGYAFARGIPVVGVRTDFRPNQERGLNIMLSRACAAFVYRPSFDEEVEGLAADIAKALRKVLNVRLEDLKA
jgi:nucleoside 2-deoxyribosyltransferase